ncbi:MAG: hypothetical protein UU56_C0008G0049 [Candidatus Curtissbacteria bacterium GW2011_GWA2_41_24]|uniref:Uncharacterized protein n=3 Tax=Candidatus Curtissiibacteriota TaxID=1752717 RepID=A0A0G0VX26_9BACT|nr:MAG: hypothetical protein UU56_C0008G0049 [Candidatus Curtissbacteria bacterium GW2011_GWA2_41_24]
MGLDCLLSMVERLRVTSPSEQDVSSNGDGQVLFKIGDLPRTRRHFLRSLFASPLDLPFDLWGLGIDLQRGGLAFLRDRFDNHLSTEGIPRGHDQPTILATGLLGSKWSLEPMGNWLSGLDYDVYYAEYPYGVNREEIKKREQILLKKTREVFRATGKRVNWWLWSKATLEALMAALEHPQQVKKMVNHMDLVGIPVKCRLNSAVGLIYLAISNGDDFRLRAKYGDEVEVRVPEGVGYTIIESENNEVCQFDNGKFQGTYFVNTGHSALGVHPKVKIITAFSLAGREVSQEMIDRLAA